MSESKLKKVIVIGGGVAGMNVVNELINSSKQFDITCITKEAQCDYSTCGIPYVVEGVISSFEEIILHKPEFYSEKDVKLLMNTEVLKVNIEDQIIKILDYKSSESEVELYYDFLVIATGRKPFKPPIDGLDLNRVYTLMNYDDGQTIKRDMVGCKNAIVIGGGIIGLEMAVAFKAQGMKTTVIELTPGVLPAMLDHDMAELVEDWLIKTGIKIIKESRVKQLIGSDKVEKVLLEDDSEIETDLVLISSGIRPNTNLAQDANLDTGPFGGILTDDMQRVFSNGNLLENIFSVGDCVETKNFITGQNMVSALASTAILQAKVVAENICGNHRIIKGNVNPTVTTLHGLQIGSVGLTSFTAKSAGIEFNSATSIGKSRARYYPGWKNIYFKFIARDNKIIGAQIIGEEDIKERINTITLAIRENIPIETILETERCFTPPLALLKDPMNKALMKLIS